MTPRRPLVKLLDERYPELPDPLAAIVAGEVRVNGVIITNPRANVDPSASIVVAAWSQPKGERKLGAALDALNVPITIADKVAVDIGASTGGFTSELRKRGARRVYAVDVGFGQLLGRLRQDPGVVNLESVNAADLDRAKVPDTVDIVTIDVSFTPLSVLVPQVTPLLALAPRADLLALVKPMFELQVGALPDEGLLPEALDRAVAGIEGAGWHVLERFRSSVLGNRGAVEFWVRAVKGG